jgi:hypothetical protein
MMKRASTSHLAAAVSCQLLRLSAPKCSQYSMLLPDYHEYCYEQNSQRERTLSNTECRTRREAWHSSQSERAVCCCGCAFLKWKSKSSRWFGRALPVALSRRMWISLIRYWRSGSIWQKCEEEEQAFLLREFLGIKSRSKSKSSDEVGEGVPLGCWSGCCWYYWYFDRVVKVSFGRVSAASLLELSGTMKWSVLFLCLWTGRCLSW